MKIIMLSAASVLGVFLSSSGFAQEKPVDVSISLRGFSVPNMYFFPDLDKNIKHNNLGAIPDGGSATTAISGSANTLGFNFIGLSGENTFAVFQKDAGGNVNFSGWKDGGEGLWVHINKRVSPTEIIVGPFEILVSVYDIDVQNLCFFGDSFKPGNYILKEFTMKDVKTVGQLQPGDFSKGVIYQDYKSAGKASAADRLTMDAKTGAAALKYGFAAGDVFESGFVRIPVNVASSKYIFMDVEGDSSKNNFFIIVHDASGEQHLVLKTCLVWQGWRQVGVDLKMYFESPEKMERFIIHWGGDENQKIDFPIQAIDIGVAKRGMKIKDRGQVRFRKVRFIE